MFSRINMVVLELIVGLPNPLSMFLFSCNRPFFRVILKYILTVHKKKNEVVFKITIKRVINQMVILIK